MYDFDFARMYVKPTFLRTNNYLTVYNVNIYIEAKKGNLKKTCMTVKPKRKNFNNTIIIQLRLNLKKQIQANRL